MSRRGEPGHGPAALELAIEQAIRAAMHLDAYTSEIGNFGCPIGHMGQSGLVPGGGPDAQQLADLEMVCAVQASVREKVDWLRARMAEMERDLEALAGCLACIHQKDGQCMVGGCNPTPGSRFMWKGYRRFLPPEGSVHGWAPEYYEEANEHG